MNSNFYKKEIEEYQKKSNYYSIKHTYILLLLLVGLFFYQFFVLGEGVSQYSTHTSDIFTGTYYTLVTALFFHTGIFHLLGNLVGLFVFGRVVERHVGWRIYGIFLLGGIFANVVSNTIAFVVGQEYFSLGASSGIAAIIIFAILLDPFKLTTLLGWLLIGLDIYGINNPQSTTNHLAHLSGYFSLIFLYFLVEKYYRKKVMKGLLVNIIMILVVYLILSINGLVSMRI